MSIILYDFKYCEVSTRIMCDVFVYMDIYKLLVIVYLATWLYLIICVIDDVYVDTGYSIYNLIYISTFNARYFSVLCCYFQNMSCFKTVVFVVYDPVSYTCIAYCLCYICNALRGISWWFYCTALLYLHDIWKILAIKKNCNFLCRIETLSYICTRNQKIWLRSSTE